MNLQRDVNCVCVCVRERERERVCKGDYKEFQGSKELCKKLTSGSKIVIKSQSISTPPRNWDNLVSNTLSFDSI